MKNTMNSRHSIHFSILHDMINQLRGIVSSQQRRRVFQSCCIETPAFCTIRKCRTLHLIVMREIVWSRCIVLFQQHCVVRWIQRCQQNHDKLQDECSQKKNQGTIVDAGADSNNSIATENSMPIILCYNAATVILSPTVVHVASSMTYNTLSRHEICWGLVSSRDQDSPWTWNKLPHKYTPDTWKRL